MIKFIKLTTTPFINVNIEESDIFIAVDSIIAIEEEWYCPDTTKYKNKVDCSRVYSTANAFQVTETPEQILKMLDESQ